MITTRFNGIVLLLIVLTFTTVNSLPVGGRSRAAAVSDRRRNDARALPVVISQYSNVRNSKTDTPVLKESLKAVEPETTTTTTTRTTTTTTTAATTTTELAVPVSEAAIQSEEIVDVAETLPLSVDDHTKINDDATLSPAEEQQTELPMSSDPDTRPAPIQTEPDQEGNAAIFDQVEPSQSADADAEIKDDEVAKEDEKGDGKSPVVESDESVAPLASPPAQQEEQNFKLEQLFEEDRSFKNNFDDLTALIDDKATNESPITPSSLFKELFQWDNDEEMSTDEKKSDNISKKDKEKQLTKAKESKPSKLSKFNEDPVDEYEENLRRKRSQDGQNVEADEAPVITLVPAIYPVFLPNGESTLSDRVKLEEQEKSIDEKAEEPVVISLVPSNYPVVLPNGESTLSDKLKPEEVATIEKSSDGNEEKPVIISLVPHNYPVVLPDGTSTLSDQIARNGQEPEDSQKPETAAVVIGSVPTNFPVVLPDGTQTLSEKISQTQENSDFAPPIVIGKVPSNFPVVLPDGTQTLSDKISKITQENKDAPITIALVPDNFPVVLPSGEQTTSDKL